jgi:hypothetical protein
MSARRGVIRTLLVASSLLFACDSDSEDDGEDGADASDGADESGATGTGETGTFTLDFSVANGVRANPNLMDELVGPVYGEVYLSTDVTLLGPAEGAVPVANVAVEDIDLTAAESKAGAWTSDPLPPGNYIFLGAFDIDDNAAEFDGGPDTGDPVTLPTQKFDVVAGEDTPFTIVFDLVYS